MIFYSFISSYKVFFKFVPKNFLPFSYKFINTLNKSCLVKNITISKNNSVFLRTCNVNKKSNLSINTVAFIDNFFSLPLNKYMAKKLKETSDEYVTIIGKFYLPYIDVCFAEDFDLANGWKIIFDQMDEDEKVTRLTFDTYLIKKCSLERNVALANSYVNFLKSRNEDLNFVALSIYFELLGENYTKIDLNLFKNTYKKVLENEPLFQETRLPVINGLLQAKYWDEAFHHLKILEKSHDNFMFFAKALNLAIEILAKEKGFDAAYEYVKFLEDKCKHISSERLDMFLNQATIIALLESIHKIELTSEFKYKQFELVFQAMQNFEVKVDEDSIDSLSTLLSNYWKFYKTKITSRFVI